MKKSYQSILYFKKKKQLKNNNQIKNFQVLMKNEDSNYSICEKNNQLFRFINKKPLYDKNKDKFNLDFFGRVKIPSNKNFQLINLNQPNQIALQFGKFKKNLFNLDYRYPFCLKSALGVAFSVFDK